MSSMSVDTRRIGRVAGVESERVAVELDPGAPGLVKAGASGVVPIGEINSYITFPGGPHRLVAVVTAIRMSPARMAGQTEYAAEAAVDRQLDATIVGRFESGVFEPGISTYPSLFAPVSVATPAETEALFLPRGQHSIVLGEAVVAPGQDVRLDADLLMARHAAVLGSTGSGKSCTVTALIDAVLDLDVPDANIVIFDTNGEYAAAFPPGSRRALQANACVIGGALASRHTPLVLPGWFMDNADHLSLFQASEGVQEPLLQRAIADARLGSAEAATHLSRIRSVMRSVSDIDAIEGRKPQEALHHHLQALQSGVEGRRAEAEGGDGAELAFWTDLGAILQGCAALGLATGNDAWDRPTTFEQRQQIDGMAAAISRRISDELDRLGLGSRAIVADFDAPRYYSLTALVESYLPARIALESLNEPRIRNYAATLVMRISRLLADGRYDFVTRVPPYPDALARFLRLILGRQPLAGCSEDDAPPWAAEYRDSHDPAQGRHSVTIIDLSNVASDVLETMTALLARLLLDFAQRVEPRGAFPMWLVLEEAHRYIPAIRGEGSHRSTAAFERIAKEGRKFGVGLLLASQRPSELSRTVLAQCGTIIAHRVVNPDDQDLIRHATPLAGRDVLRQLPGLAPQHAVVLGEAVPAPTYVRVRDVEYTPRSNDPDFIQRWSVVADADLEGKIENVSRSWEEGTEPT